jgi:hypothetical protein
LQPSRSAHGQITGCTCGRCSQRARREQPALLTRFCGLPHAADAGVGSVRLTAGAQRERVSTSCLHGSRPRRPACSAATEAACGHGAPGRLRPHHQHMNYASTRLV